MKVKYPRTYHLDFSPGLSSDDKVQRDLSNLEGKRVIVSMKMDGENTSMYRDGIHARSLDSRNHPSRDWIKDYHAAMAHEIPEGWRICGENLYARHSLAYDNLISYFYVFSIWDEHNVCQSWDDTLINLELLGLVPVEFFETTFNVAELKKYAAQFDTSKNEGFVVRLADSFHYDDFNKNVVKWVRPAHVQTDEHWMHKQVVPNQLLRR